MSISNGEPQKPVGPLELQDVLSIENSDGTSLAFEVVGILEDPEDGVSYAVLIHERDSEEESDFIVTDRDGNLLQDDQLAQEILDDFLAYAEDGEESPASDGETR
jgi:hypothetical protein